MNKKGFTLIELLAVIVILALIALIAYPIIDDLLDRQEKNAFKISAEGIYNAVEMDQANRGFITNLKYEFNDKILTLVENNGTAVAENIKLSGEITDGEGTVIIDANDNIIIEIENENWCAYNEADATGQYYSTIKLKDGRC